MRLGIEFLIPRRVFDQLIGNRENFQLICIYLSLVNWAMFSLKRSSKSSQQKGNRTLESLQ